jgi:uncharacterized protein YdhG (YjbR/CyaY superfamily)
MDSQILKYIEKQKSPQKEIIQKVRIIFQKTLPNVEEKMAWGVITFAEKKFYLAAFKDHVHIGFAITGLDKDDLKWFKGTGTTMRHVQLTSLEDIDEKKLIKIIRLVNKKSICKSR